MIINVENINKYLGDFKKKQGVDELFDFSVHDDFFCGMQYDFNRKTIVIQCKGTERTAPGPYEMIFRDVIHLRITEGNFWGEPDSFYEIAFDLSEQRIQSFVESGPLLEMEPKRFYNATDYILFSLLFLSGDGMAVVCKELEITRTDLKTKDSPEEPEK